MYNVSDSYKKAISKALIKNRIAGTLTLQNGDNIAINDSNIIKGSLSINNKAVNNSDFCLGAAYVGELSVTIYNTEINRYSLYGAKIVISYFLELENGEEEEIPLGVYFVDTPKRAKKLIQLKCYDAMTRFDINVEENTWGTAYELLLFACKKCGVTLSNTKEEIEAMCNGKETYSLNKERVGTYRDLISYISIVLGGYATINRRGKLEIRTFHTEPDKTITANKRTDSTIYDYKTFFNSVTARFIAQQNYYPYTEELANMRNGLLLDLGDIPIVQGLESFKHTILRNLLNVIKDINYNPCECSIAPDPSIDLGDGLTLENVNNSSENIFTIVTAYNFTYHNDEKITSSGSDALLANVSDSTGKRIDSLEAQLAAKNLVIKYYTNAEEIDVEGAETNIIKLSWSAFEDTTAVFFATVPIELNKDGNLIITYYNSFTEISRLIKYLARGKHFVTFMTYVPSKAGNIISFNVSARLEYFESDDRIQNAGGASDFKAVVETETMKFAFTSGTSGTVIDTTPPAGKILKEEIKAVVFAQGLNATDGWDGTISVQDDLSNVEFNSIKAITSEIKEKTGTSHTIPHKNILADTLKNIGFSGLQVYNIDDLGYTDKTVIEQTIVINTDDVTEYPYNFETKDYDMTDPTIFGIKNITIDSGSGVLFSVSFDSGKSWQMHDGTSWREAEEGGGMTSLIMSGITSDQWKEKATTGKYRFKISIPDSTNKIKTFIVNYINK